MLTNLLTGLNKKQHDFGLISCKIPSRIYAQTYKIQVKYGSDKKQTASRQSDDVD